MTVIDEVGWDGEIDLGLVEDGVGHLAFERGRTYARRGRVLKVSWDEKGGLLSGQVVGGGQLCETTIVFSGDNLEFDYGDCTCPVAHD
jgi:uncharacterized Zn finger protein